MKILCKICLTHLLAKYALQDSKLSKLSLGRFAPLLSVLEKGYELH